MEKLMAESMPNQYNPASAIREEVISSWNRCQEMGVNPQRTQVPADSSVLVPMQPEWKPWQDLDLSFNQMFNLFLHNHKCAVFYTDMDLTVIIQTGDEQLLKELNSLNLGIGTNLSEQRCGTNALAMAARHQAKSFIVGSEHYLDPWKDFAGVASPILMDGSIPIAYVMYMVDQANFNGVFHNQAIWFMDLQNHLINMKLSNLELSQKNTLPELGIDPKESGIILTDEHGLVINANSLTMKFFRVDVKEILGKQIAKAFPELAAVLGSFQPGETMVNHDISVNHPGSSSKLLLNCMVHKRKKPVGLIVSLTEKRINSRVSTKQGTHGAHYTFNDLIGISPSFLEAKNVAEVAAVSNCNVMIIGESGSGKELFAQSIHNASNRREEPFISLNCAAIPKELIYSELFGYVEGAFTGAKKGGAPGKFELANNGTLFLDEISEIPTDMQAVLLRVLEDDTVSRIGSSTPIPINVRVIAATNRDICRSVASNDFRLDLYHRLCTVRIDISPLRRRKDDIPVLADYFLRVFNNKHEKNISRITPEAVAFMQNCLWLGNVRELRNVIERGVIFCSDDELDVKNLPKELLTHHRDSAAEMPSSNKLGEGLIHQFQAKINEKNQIEELMRKHHNNKTLVAQELGITRATLYRRLKFLGIAD